MAKRIDVVHPVGEVTEIAALTVFVRVPVVRQFNLGVLIARCCQEYESEATLFAILAAQLLQAQQVAVEVQRGVEVGDAHHRVQIFHGQTPCWTQFRFVSTMVTDTGTDSKLKKIRTITLDLDDTLWEIHPVIKRAEQALYAWLGENYPRITELYQPDDMRAVRTQVMTEFADRSHDLTFLRRTVLGRVGTAAGYGHDFIDGAFEVFDAVRNDVELFPEVIPTLEALKGHCKLIAVTNGNANLETIGIAHLFHDIVTATKAGAAKPAIEVFDMAVKIGGAGREQTLHVGDHPEYDVDGARNAGLHTVWVNRTGSDWPDQFAMPDIEVSHVGELPERLEGNLER